MFMIDISKSLLKVNLRIYIYSVSVSSGDGRTLIDSVRILIRLGEAVNISLLILRVLAF